MREALRHWIGLGVSFAVVFAAAGIGGRFTAASVGDWYVQLHKPSWTPPGWVFGPVWAVLYLTMAVAAWLVWLERGSCTVAVPLVAFGVQLFLNVAWSGLFFGLRSPAAGLVDIALLWVAIAATVVLFWRVTALAGALLIPYWLWVSFAALLNLAIWRMNA